MSTRSLIFTIALSFAATAYGFLAPAEGQFVAEGEYLYLQPLVENSAYIIQTQASGNATPKERKFNTFGGHSGVRVTGKYGLSNCAHNHVSGSWTYVWQQAREHTRSAGSNLEQIKWNVNVQSPATPFNGTASSRIKVQYADGDLVLSHHLMHECSFNLFFLGGLQFLDLSYREDIEIVTGNNRYDVSQTCERRGVGLKTGVDVLFGLPGWFRCLGNMSIHAKATGALLVSRNNAVYRGAETLGVNTSFRMQNQRIDTILSAAELKLGLNYLRSLWGRSFAVEIGYNMIYYPRAIDQVTFTDKGPAGLGNAGITFDHYTSLGLHGLYASASMRF